MDFRDTLNLPQTSFPMKANLAQREPDYLKRWEKLDLYHLIREERADRETFYLHDGPPYANGAIHLGTALNKILKDMVNKSNILRGLNIHYRPGWDCHGLPIEQNIVQKMSDEERDSVHINDIRKKCRNFALKFVDKHRKSFKRLGVIGEWERPYLTLKPEYEAEEIRQFANLVKEGYVYQGMKPIHWCPEFRTALAEAEVEYDNKVSDSIFVRFPLNEESHAKLKRQVSSLDNKPVNIVIWTTTPWTLPANRAVCVHPNLIYSIIENGDEFLILAQDLLSRFQEETGVNSTGKLDVEITGKELEDIGIQMKHPLSSTEVPLICGTHVTLEQGSGAVHTAPGHGHEDYLVGQQYGLEVYCPVDETGCYTNESPVCVGKPVLESNEVILDMLREKGLLIHASKFEHQYPYFWRGHAPIIFRATRQWFISLEENNLRQRLLDAIDQVNWVPNWGIKRIRAMVENRAEWCISRQRAWGVPIPAFYAPGKKEAILDHEFLNELSQVFQKEGAEFWYKAIDDPTMLEQFPSIKRLVPEGVELSELQLEKDILDVWFDSGVSHHSVMRQDEGVYPVDMYLEGSDQHRGWFQSSLVTAIGAGYEPPYKTVLTHGFTVDEYGKKLSKSKGNFVELDSLVKEMGADILRLWVSSEDFRNDMSFSQDILKRVTESYRRIRNTVRFLISNLYDFTPDDAVPEEDRQSIDKWILTRWRESKIKIIGHYERYDFHRIFYELNNLCSVELSGIYLDIVKDRMYVSGKDSLDRRAAQSTFAEILVEITACTAPILSFTCEEIWDYLKELKLCNNDTVFLYDLDQSIPEIDKNLLEKWNRLITIRNEAVKAIEIQRKAGTIGHPLDCCVTIQATDDEWKQLIQESIAEKRGSDLASICIVSKVVAGEVSGENLYDSETLPLRFKVEKALGEKCPRCWHYHEDVNLEDNNPCPRCKSVLESQSDKARI